MFFCLFIHRNGVLTSLAWLVPHETAAVSAQVLCTPYNHAPCHFMQSHIRKVHAYLAVTCHMHFWQNDRDLLRATAVRRGWNGYRNKSQHRSRPCRRKFSRRASRDSNPRPFNHESGALTTELFPPPELFPLWLYKQDCNTTVVPNVNVIAQGTFYGARFTHETVMPFIKQIILQQQTLE